MIDAETKPIAAKMSELAERFRDSAARVERLELELIRAQAEHKVLREVTIPEAMEEYGSTLFRLPDGTTIAIQPELYVRIPKGNEERAFKYLEKLGEGGLIKRQIVVAFNMGQEAETAALLIDLRKKYPGVAQKADIHWATLTSWARRRLEDGLSIDESITCQSTNVAEITGATGQG